MPDQFSQAPALDAGRLQGMIAQPTNDNAADAKVPSPNDDDEGQFLDVRVLKNQFLDYLDTKVDEIEEQKMSRHMYHGAHWTPDQIKVLRRRHQPPITWNRINRKINGIVGVVERLRSDPEALPNHVRSEQGAELATNVIRYVLQRNDFKGIEPWCLLQACIDGIAGVQMVLNEDDEGTPDIALPWVIGDEYFYDPKSYRADFKDGLYEGLAKWIDIGEAIEMFPDKAEDLRNIISGDAGELFMQSDREYKWVLTSSKRVRMVEHWYKNKGKWCWAFYVSSMLLAEGVSPYLDERNKSTSSFNMFSVAVDHDGDRYGFVRNLKGPQDALNQSKSKALHVANSRRIVADKGAVDDVEKARIEMARPDGYIEVNPGLNLKPDDKPQDVAAFTQMAEAAGQEMDAFANINMAVLSGSGLANISGRAIELLRQPGMAELGPFILNIRQWKLQLYRRIWTTAQRQWKAEKWIRLRNDDSQKPIFVQLNGMSLDQFGRPVLVNALGALDVDITLDEGPDVATLMQETYDLLKGYPPGTFPPAVIIEASQLPRTEKTKLLQMLKPQPNPLQMEGVKTQLETAKIKNVKTAADARKSDAMAAKAFAEIHASGNQAQMDGAELQHRMWAEALQLFTPQMQPGQKGPDGQQGSPQMQPGPPPIPHPVMPQLPA